MKRVSGRSDVEMMEMVWLEGQRPCTRMEVALRCDCAVLLCTTHMLDAGDDRQDARKLTRNW